MAVGLLDIPEEVLSIILVFLIPRDFLALCRTSKGLYTFQQDPTYWRTLTSATFRLPISPLLKADGARWYYLYKRLKTQTALYTWGQGLHGDLGPGRSPRVRARLHQTPRREHLGPIFHIMHRPMPFERTSSAWPTQVHLPVEIKVIADLQCGGWSTSILSSEGKIYVTGIINADGRYVGESTDQFQCLQYLDQSTSAIKQFSSGRRHILALTDDGEILSWDRINTKGLKVFSRHGRDFGGRPVRVVAGWAESSAYIPEVGIVFWDPLVNDNQDQMLDGLHIIERVVPETAKTYTANHKVNEVVAHVVLERFIVWITTDSKLWAYDSHIGTPEQQIPYGQPFQVPGYSSPARVLQDIQGQFNKFAVFTDTGEVLEGHIDFLEKCANIARSNPSVDDPTKTASPSLWPDIDNIIEAKPRDIQALQHNQVIKLAFGDHHYHALHANGRITSYGIDPQCTGALGFGDFPGGSRFRGLRRAPALRTDAILIPHAENRGRYVWFEPEKRDWLRWLEETLQKGSVLGDIRDAEGHLRGPAFLWEFDQDKQFMFSEWIEQEGKHWDDGPVNTTTTTGTGDGSATVLTHSSSTPVTSPAQATQDFQLDPYFAVSIAAAGWHSGALVIIDEEMAHATRQKWLTTIDNASQELELNDESETESDAPTHLMPGHFDTKPTETSGTEGKDQEVYIWKTQGFPKISLPNGYVMPGEGEERIWRDGKPSLSDLGLAP